MSKARLNFEVEADFKHRVRKAAAHNDMTVSAYMAMAITDYMQRSGDWSLRGPMKGSGDV